jgi:hypothetical protein
MMALPALMPVTTPVKEPAVAVVMSELIQVPPVVRSPRLVVEPAHIVVAPLMGDGCG